MHRIRHCQCVCQVQRCYQESQGMYSGAQKFIVMVYRLEEKYIKAVRRKEKKHNYHSYHLSMMTSQTTLCFCMRCLQRNPLGVQVTVATRDAHTQRDIDEELEHIDGKATT